MADSQTVHYLTADEGRDKEEFVLPDKEKILEFPQPGPDWFSQLFGFEEIRDHEEIQRFLFLHNNLLVSRVNGKSYAIGSFSTPSLAELRQEVLGNKELVKATKGKLVLKGKEGEVSALQALPQNKHSTFQAASQFNCLEFVGPSVVPENGVMGYVFDRTQGPACSISAGPATVYRNYFVEVDGQVGQTRDKMIDNLHDVSEYLGNVPNGKYFETKGGYTLASDSGLKELNGVLKNKPLDEVMQRLRIGVHEDVQVTTSSWGKKKVKDPSHTITQVFGSACSISYSRNSNELWKPFASMVLMASYEATLLVALKTMYKHKGKCGSKRVYLTLLGGGVFGNSLGWIRAAIQEACKKMEGFGLEVIVVGKYEVPKLS